MLLNPSDIKPRTLSRALLGFLAGCLLHAQIDLTERLYLSGEKAYLAERFEEAMDTWNQLIQQSPQSPFSAQALFFMAQHHVNQSQKQDRELNLNKALGALETIKQKHIAHEVAAKALLLRGRILSIQAQKQSDLKEAQGEFHRVVDLFPAHPSALEARFELGNGCMRQQQPSTAIRHFASVIQADPKATLSASAMLSMAEGFNQMGDLPSALRALSRVKHLFPETQQSQEAQWRMDLLIKHGLLRPALLSEGAWPSGQKTELKSPTHLERGIQGEIYLYQDGWDQAYERKGTEWEKVGDAFRNARAMCFDGEGLCLLSARQLRRGNGTVLELENLRDASGLCMDSWQNLWITHTKGGLTLVDVKGGTREWPAPGGVAIAPLSDGAILASDTNRSLLFLDAAGQPRLTLPYGKDFPKPFKKIVALATDPLGHVAAIVDGDFEGVAIWNRHGELLRYAEFKALGLKGKFRGLAMDRQGGLILADRSNDLLIRLN